MSPIEDVLLTGIAQFSFEINFIRKGLEEKLEELRKENSYNVLIARYEASIQTLDSVIDLYNRTVRQETDKRGLE